MGKAVDELLGKIEYTVRVFPPDPKKPAVKLKGRLQANGRTLVIWLKISESEIQPIPPGMTRAERVADAVKLNKEVIRERFRCIIEKEELHFLRQEP